MFGIGLAQAAAPRDGARMRQGERRATGPPQRIFPGSSRGLRVSVQQCAWAWRFR